MQWRGGGPGASSCQLYNLIDRVVRDEEGRRWGYKIGNHVSAGCKGMVKKAVPRLREFAVAEVVLKLKDLWSGSSCLDELSTSREYKENIP